MSENSPETAVTVGNPGHRGEDPTLPDLLEIQTVYRQRIDELALDPETSFYDKIYALEATQYGRWQACHRSGVVEALDEARDHKQPVVLGVTSLDKTYHNRTSKLVLGYLHDTNPWDFVSTAGEDEPAAVDLQVRFKAARHVSDTTSWFHESYGQGSSCYETAPTTCELQKLAMPVGLVQDMHGSENLYARVRDYAQTLKVGTMAIHGHVSKLQADKDVRSQNALHAAVSIALAQITRELN